MSGFITRRLETMLESMFQRLIDRAEDRRFRQQAQLDVEREAVLMQVEAERSVGQMRRQRAAVRRSIIQGYADNDEVRRIAESVARKLVKRQKAASSEQKLAGTRTRGIVQ